MKRLFALILLASVTACADPADPGAAAGTSAPAPEVGALALGEAVPSGEAITPAELISGAGEYAGQEVLVEGTAREVCQMAGCWLTFADGSGQTVRINVPRDESESYVFTFPKDASGQTVRVLGTLAVDTESVEDQRHYAQDGGATAAEIEAITAPKRTLVLTAVGAHVMPDATS